MILVLVIAGILLTIGWLIGWEARKYSEFERAMSRTERDAWDDRCRKSEEMLADIDRMMNRLLREERAESPVELFPREVFSDDAAFKEALRKSQWMSRGGIG